MLHSSMLIMATTPPLTEMRCVRWRRHTIIFLRLIDKQLKISVQDILGKIFLKNLGLKYSETFQSIEMFLIISLF